MFFTYLRRELRRRRKAAIVVALGLALGIGLVITVSSVSTGMRDAQDEVLHSLYGVGTDITVTKEQENAEEGGSQPQRFTIGGRDDGENATATDDRLMPMGGFDNLDDSVVDKVKAQNGVATAVGALSLNDMKFNGEFKPGEIQQEPPQDGGGAGENAQPGQGGQGRQFVGGGGADIDIDSFTVTGVDVSELTVGPLSSSKITSGAAFAAADTNALKAVVDSAYAKDKDLKVGSTITIKGKKFKVAGIATADTGASTSNVYIPLKRAQDLSDADMKGKVSTVYVKADSSDAIDTVKSAIDKNIDGATVTSSADLAEQVSGNLSTASNLANNIGKWLSIAVLAAAFLVAGLLTMSAVSRRVREFGTLKAVGWRSSRVIRQVMGEAFVNGILGGALGIALGIGGAYLVSTIAPTLTATTGGQGGGRGGPAGPMARVAESANQKVEIALQAPVTIQVIVLAVALAAAGGIIAGCFGGWRASRLRPADALRRVE
ncbi:ABC transporter permease [Streptomyces sp. NPDC051940]|uniref:ABC transporter permease n=1 Tax=Streptomyces sp. NPDC051940 TaxID=3155675 RepID=UPI003445FC36